MGSDINPEKRAQGLEMIESEHGEGGKSPPHTTKRPGKLSKKQVDAILAKVDWPAYHNSVIDAIIESHRCRCKDCMRLPKHQRYIL